MNPNQVAEIVVRIRRLKLSQGELLQLAREAAHDSRLADWRHLSRDQARYLVISLDRIEISEDARRFRRRDRELVGTR